MAVSLDTLLDDLLAETADIETMIAPLDDVGIARPTPAAGWDVRDQVTHLAFFDEAATQAAVDPVGFRRAAAVLMAGGMDFPDRIAATHAHLGAAEVRAWFTRARSGLVRAFRGLDPRTRLPDGTRQVIPHSPSGPAVSPSVAGFEPRDFGPTRRVPLGTIAGARSGDKGGNANIGLWTRTDVEYEWLRGYLDEARLRMLLPEAAGLTVRRFELPNLRALNFVVVGLLGEGVAAATRPDPQAKGLGEYVRSRLVNIPEAIIRP
jgi:hypothetical protein